MGKKREVGLVRLVVEVGAGEDTLGRVAGESVFRSVRGARDRLAEIREELEQQGWQQETVGSPVWWKGESWWQGLVVDDRGEVV